MTATQKAGQSERKYRVGVHHQVRSARSRQMQQFFFFIRWMRTTTCDAKELHHFRFVPNAHGRTITLISGNISGCQTAGSSTIIYTSMKWTNVPEARSQTSPGPI